MPGAGLADDLALAEEAARTAGEVLVEYFGRPASGVEQKSSATDLVSDADRDAERLIAELLLLERPDDGMLGEEGAERSGSSGRRWVFDPLDGTTNFLLGIPTWAVSVALEDGDGGLVGVVHDPMRAETFRASRGGGADLAGVPIRVREGVDLAEAMIATGFSYRSEVRARQAEVVRRVLPAVRDVRRAGAAALDLAWVAAGRVDGYYERGLQHWDWAAGKLLLQEAGGATVPLEGEPLGMVAAHPGLLPELAELVRD